MQENENIKKGGFCDGFVAGLFHFLVVFSLLSAGSSPLQLRT